MTRSSQILANFTFDMIEYTEMHDPPKKVGKNNRKAMNRNWGNQKANPALKTKAGNK